jgi:predicted small lipoprotein YifL
MKNYLRLLLILIPVAILMLTACGAKQPVVTVSPAAVPNSLVTIEAAAEDIIDFAPSGNWDKIGVDVTDIENAWKSYQSQASQDGAPQEIQDKMTSALSDLETAAASKDASATMQGSNDVSAAVVELFALYTPKVPTDIGRLDVLERQVILDVAAKDYSAATKSLAKTKSVWEEVKPSVLEHNGKDVAAQFEASLTTQESALKAKDDAALTNEARNGLEIVDTLEGLY